MFDELLNISLILKMFHSKCFVVIAQLHAVCMMSCVSELMNFADIPYSSNQHLHILCLR